MLWIKSLHIIFAVAWFAGLFYLPRLFVYHAECDDAAGRARFAVMERRLYRSIMLPAMAGTLLFGGGLLFYGYGGGWLGAKILLVMILVVYHLICGKFAHDFRLGQNRRSAYFYRWWNEVPTLLLIGIVILAVVKPF